MGTLATQTKLANDLGAQAARTALFFGKAKAQPFVAAVTAGINSISDTTNVTVKMLIDGVFTLLTLFAVIFGKVPFQRLVAVCKYLYDDLTTGAVELIQIFRAWGQAKQAVKNLQAATTASTDPNLSKDELALATQFGVLAKMFALFFGKATNNVKVLTDAVVAGIDSVDNRVEVTEQQVIDGFFTVGEDIFTETGNAIAVQVIATGESIYDDFAGGKVTLEELYAHFYKTKVKIQTPPVKK